MEKPSTSALGDKESAMNARASYTNHVCEGVSYLVLETSFHHSTSAPKRNFAVHLPCHIGTLKTQRAAEIEKSESPWELLSYGK